MPAENPSTKRNPFAALLHAGRALAAGLALSKASQAQELLWPQGAPGARGTADADKPTLQAYPAAKDRANGAAVVVCPGGGYTGLAMVHEGRNVALWLNSLGLHAFVLKYRVAPYRHPVEMNDAKRAMRWVRANAARFGVDTARVGILGFSAGGHLASTVATHSDPGDPAAADPVDRLSSRPGLQILVYPVITMDAAFTHGGSRLALLGSNPPQALVDSLSNEKQVTAGTPPAFLAHTRDDNVVPYRNAQVYADSCLRKGVPVELRSYPSGPHGYGLADGKDGAPARPDLAAWTAQAAAWMEARGFFRVPAGFDPAAPSRPSPGAAAGGRDALGRLPADGAEAAPGPRFRPGSTP